MRKNKSAWVIGGTLLLLAAAIVLLMFLNDTVEVTNTLQKDPILAVTANGETQMVCRGMLEEIGIQTFTAHKKNDGKAAVQVEYQGVPLIKICEELKLDISGAKKCVAFAVDGYITPVAIEKVLDPENVFVVTGQNGEPLAEKAGGPFMLVIAKDPFSQFWCKYVARVEFE
ncbi:MAG: molybdopterin-dependent oxidoreductase [Oscillospiraceae bacterium]|nr:molybdopterin-dependent oxidoreductase [Oscillospiraceae bacterium]